MGTDRSITELARRQHGFVTRSQLLSLGLGPRAIHHRVAAGRLIRVHLGVYAVGHLPSAPIARSAAALLACGRGAILSHRSAAVLWKMLGHYDGPPEVTVRSLRRRPGIRVHRSTALAPADITTHHGVRVTSPARTLFDIAPRLDDGALLRAANDGRLAGYLHLGDLAELLDRQRRGARRLRALIDDAAPTRSEFEDAFKRFLERHGLPAPRMNVIVGGFLVDALFAEERLVVELDGYLFHQDRGAFERDRRRDVTLLAAGIRTVRLTWRRMTGAPSEEAAMLRAILSAGHPERSARS